MRFFARCSLFLALTGVLTTATVSANPILTAEVAVGAAKALGLTADLLTIYQALGMSKPTNSLSLTVSGTERTFDLTLVGGKVVASSNGVEFKGTASGNVTLPGGGQASGVPFWNYDLILTITDGFFNDAIQINGYVQHAIGPDKGEAAPAAQLPFNVILTSNGNSNKKTATDTPKTKPHPGPEGHTDSLYGINLTATIDVGTFINSIGGFTFDETATHTPEPATWSLFIVAVLSLAAARRMRRVS